MMLEKFSNLLSKDPDFSNIFVHPFKVIKTQKIKENDDFEDAKAKLGTERVIGLVQGYEIANKYCEVYLVETFDKDEMIRRFQSGNIISTLAKIEERIDRLQAIKNAKAQKG